MANHSFNIDIARQFGVSEAIVLENIYFWVEKNRANEKHLHDGSWWTYNSVKAFAQLFPYWSSRQIEKILKSLEIQDCIKIGNYNQSAYDRTKWYAITDMVNTIYANGEMDIPKRLNGYTETVEPIPDINPDNKLTDINTGIKQEILPSPFEQAIADYKEMRKTIKSPMTKRGLEMLIAKLQKMTSDEAEQIEILEQSIVGGWKTVYPLKDTNNGGKYSDNVKNAIDLMKKYENDEGNGGVW